MSPLTDAQNAGSSLRFARRVFDVATESMVAMAITFLCSSGAYTTSFISNSDRKGRRRTRAAGVRDARMHSLIIVLF